MFVPLLGDTVTEPLIPLPLLVKVTVGGVTASSAVNDNVTVSPDLARDVLLLLDAIVIVVKEGAEASFKFTKLE